MPWVAICKVLAEAPGGVICAIAARDPGVEVAIWAATCSKHSLLSIDEKVPANDL